MGKDPTCQLRLHSFGWSGSGPVVQDHLDHGASEEPKNPRWSQIHRFLWWTMIWVILDHWSVIQITPKEFNLKDSLMVSKIWELLEPRKSGIDVFISSPVSHSLIPFASVSILYGLSLTVPPDSSHVYVVQPRSFHSLLTVVLLVHVIFCLLCLPLSSGVKVRAPWQLSLNKVLKSMSCVN